MDSLRDGGGGDESNPETATLRATLIGRGFGNPEERERFSQLMATTMMIWQKQESKEEERTLRFY